MSVVGVAAGTGGEGYDRAALAGAPAERGAATPTRPMPPRPGCDRVVVVGDSLTVHAQPELESQLAAAGFDATVTAHWGRGVSHVDPPFSGLIAADEVRGSFGEASCWVIALGSNDLYQGGDDPAVAASLVEQMVAAVTPGAAVWWVNVNFHDNPDDFGLDVDEEQATSDFNAVLDARAADDPVFTVIDWYARSEPNRWWFLDAVHVNDAGSRARVELIVNALPH